MNGLPLPVVCAALLATGQLAHAQMTSTEARAEGEALGEEVRDSTSDSILASGAEAEVPTYGGTDFPHLDYVEDPVGLSTAGEAQRYVDDYRTVVDPYRTTFDPTTIDLSSAEAIEADPDTYLGPGVAPHGSAGTCDPLPPGGGGTTTYLESCNQGSVPFDEARTCNAPLIVETQGSHYWEYVCTTSGYFYQPRCSLIDDDPLGSTCTRVENVQIGQGCLQWSGTPPNQWCSEPGEPIFRQTWRCPSQLTSGGGIERDTVSISAEYLDESICEGVRGNDTCTLESETCTAPNETRVINGLFVTRACWEWDRTYQCSGVSPANDCTDLDARPECTFSHDDCLSYEPDGVTCNVYDRWYQCTTPSNGAPPPSAYVCADDLYCIDGECTSIEREASTEFKDAMVAMNVMGELRDEFDPGALKIFSGENLKCTKKLFGLSNCCSGKGVPLLTPFLCSSEDRDVDTKDDEGLCYNVGTYCSNKILGVCTTKKQSYCCYGSKLVRILNEQGKAQLGMQWGKPKDPDCEGFLIDQFQQLDLSQMDFGEVYAEFVDAAKLPDEIEMSIQIQQRIENYYNLHGGV
ncbi:MAG: conjugal transfer protein TraN [Pseudomonadota bacterium]